MSLNPTGTFSGYQLYKDYQIDLIQPTQARTYTHLGVYNNNFYALGKDSTLFQKIHFFVLWLFRSLHTDHESIVRCKRNLKEEARAELETEIQKFVVERNRLQTQISALKTELDPLETKVTTLRAELNEKTKGLESVTAEHKKVIEDHGKRSQEIASLSVRLEELRIQKSAIEQEIAGFKETETFQKIQSMQKQIADLNAEINALEAKHARKEKNYDNFEKTMQDNRARIEKLEEKIEAVTTKLKRLINEFPEGDALLKKYGIKFVLGKLKVFNPNS